MKMLKRIIYLFMLVLAAKHLQAFSMVPALEDENSRINFLNLEGGLFYADSLPLGSVPSYVPDDPELFVNQLERADFIDRINGGSYWLYSKINNNSNISRWVFDPFNSIIDTVKIYLYTREGIQELNSGYLFEASYSLHYGIPLTIPTNDSAQLLVFVQSRYFSGPAQFELTSEAKYRKKVATENSLVIACLGAVLVLAVYNLFIGAWIKDRSYFYYAAFLITSVVAWTAAFNGLSQWLDLTSYFLLIPPFYLMVIFNLLYIIHFLELRSNHPRLTRLTYGFIIWVSFSALSLLVIKPGHYMVLHAVNATIWIVSALLIGIYRLGLGYKPARFFIVAFVFLFIGGVVSIIPTVGTEPLGNNYLITLITQTIDMVLLSLALADRINILREEKVNALRQSYIVEQRAVDKEREANVKLQRALDISEEESQRKTEFLRMVSHELRTPLHSIVSSVDQWSEDDEPAAQTDLLNYISYGAARLRTQIDNLVLLAETDDGDLTPSYYDFELRPLLDRALSAIDGLKPENVAFIKDHSDNLPVGFNGDAYLIEHLLRVVIENACKYTEQGRIVFALSWDEELSIMSVLLQDTGCGMTREQLSTVFNDFVQVSRGIDRESEGLGLGLTICYRLCEVLGADFKMDSEPGIGTEVRIDLPLEPLASGLRLIEADPEHKGSILIVEDNTVNAAVLERLLEHLGYTVDLAFSGQQALEILTNKVYSIILMDVQMPVMDGITATRWIRHRGVTTPIIAVTANSDIDVRRRCIEQGMNDLLIKPVRRTDIERVLARQLPKAKS